MNIQKVIDILPTLLAHRTHMKPKFLGSRLKN